MSAVGVLSTLRLVRPVIRRGFCPACRLVSAHATSQGASNVELAAPSLTVGVVALVAAGAWVVMLAQWRSVSDMTMGLGSIESFAATWTVMMAAMMLPTAGPFVFEFARDSERRSGWQAATGLLSLTYLAVWLAFGLVCYVVYNAIQMPWPNQDLIGGFALLLAGLYGLTPLKRASQARCQALCALHGPLPFKILRSAAVAGVRYGLSCLGCSAALMVAMVVIGMSNFVSVLGITALLLVYKLGPPVGFRRDVMLSLAVSALGVVYAAVALLR